MRPSTFEYHRAESLEHALSLLAAHGEDGRPLAGGQSLVPMMNLRLARPAHLVDINGIGLDTIKQDGEVLRIGALVRHERYVREPLISKHFPVFLEGVRAIGHPIIRRHGTIGGSLAHADPTAELPLLALLYDGRIVADATSGERRIEAREFFHGAYMTALEPGDMITAVELPLPPARSAGAFIELGERRGDFAIASCGVSLAHEDGRITRAAVACAGAEQKPIRALTLEEALRGRPLADPSAQEDIAEFVDTLTPPSDHTASADYRRALIAVLTDRAIAAACMRAMETMR
jgi:CO/xanthine dehydrogenase FAD-binding subunit